MAPPKVVHLLQKYPELRAAFYPSLMPEEEPAVSALLMLKNQPPYQITKKRKERDSTAEEERESTPEKENFVDPWKIKKKLKQSDVSFQQRRLLISTKALVDTGHVFELKLKFWKSSKSYVFVDGWRKNFVERRRLKRSDVIGIFWCKREEQIFFSLLQRAPRALNESV